MAIVVVDSDILIDFTRGDSRAAEWLDSSQSASTLAISQMTEMELVVGSRNKGQLIEIKKILTRFQLILINDQISLPPLA